MKHLIMSWVAWPSLLGHDYGSKVIMLTWRRRHESMPPIAALNEEADA